MKHLYSLLLCCLFGSPVYAQVYKYFGPDSVSISKSKFDKWREDGTLPVKIGETKDTVYVQTVKRRNFRQLRNEECDQIYTYLSTISGKELDKQTPVLIFYHQGSDDCNLSGSSTTNSRRSWYNNAIGKLHQKTKASAMVIYSSADRVAELYPDIPAYYDKYRVFDKFFKYHYACGSIMVINPNGNIAYYFGEYGPGTAVELYADTQLATK